MQAIAGEGTNGADEFTLPTDAEMAAMSRGEKTTLLAALNERTDVLRARTAELDAAIDAGQKIQAVAAMGAFDDQWVIRALTPAFQTVAFLHCKNVALDETVPSPKVQANRRRRGRKPLLRHHVLRLTVPRKQHESNGGDGDQTRALHIVAGHFAHYGACCQNHEPGGRLFGRLEGVYWVPSHVRGDPDRGTVLTDFDLRL